VRVQSLIDRPPALPRARSLGAGASLATTDLHVAVRAFRLEAHVEEAVAGGAVSSEEAVACFETLAAADRVAAFAAQVSGHLVSGTKLVGW